LTGKVAELHFPSDMEARRLPCFAAGARLPRR
jgi:hypothetical protein